MNDIHENALSMTGELAMSPILIHTNARRRMSRNGKKILDSPPINIRSLLLKSALRWETAV
ncbi:hypothetical protein [Microbacter margulisiae]|uniref:Uncharacterized protein n=1 Tax=Microbacter margulisiae TaxID=1350067 RepID=A0A7W5DT80_9PORP|nr:hypothetical protein [Microbacter margulisiae]MBB3188476.1 hypothetical protein [Microbacter margulisiae]